MTFDDLPDAPDPALDPPATFSLKAAAMVLALKNMIVQIRAVLANMSIVAAGGAYALQYTVGANPGAGILTPQLANQQTTPIWYFGETDSRGVSITAILDSLFASAAAGASTSGVKASVRITKLGDLTKWIQFSVTSQPNTYGTYRALAVTPVAASAASPFAYGDLVVVQITRNGDAGTAPSSMRVQDQKASGAAGGTNVAGVNTRTLNTTLKNTIPGASVASNQITLPAGKYKFSGSAPAFSTNGHHAYLYNVTAGATLLPGSIESSNANYPSVTRSIVMGEFTLASTSVLELRHYTTTVYSGGGLGTALSASGQVGVFAELNIEMVA